MPHAATTLRHHRASITLNVVYLARLREAFGRAGEVAGRCRRRRDASATCSRTLRARGGAWAAELAPGRAVRVAVNHAMARDDAPVRAGDEVALFPPVTGG